MNVAREITAVAPDHVREVVTFTPTDEDLVQVRADAFADGVRFGYPEGFRAGRALTWQIVLGWMARRILCRR